MLFVSAPGDYPDVMEVLTFSAASSRVCLNISAVENNVLEKEKNYSLLLTAMEPSLVTLSNSPAHVLIIEDDGT